MLTGGLGGMGGAQPLAVTMNGGVALCVEVDPERIERRLRDRLPRHGRPTRSTRRCGWRATRPPAAASRSPSACSGNAADVYPELVRRGVVPDVVTDQTSAHDTLNGYVPNGMPYEEALELRRSDPAEYERRAIASMVEHVQAMVALQKAGAAVFDYGNNIRGVADEAGYADAFDFPGFVPAYIRPLFCARQRAVPLGRALRRPGGHRAHRRARCSRPSRTTRWSPAGCAWRPAEGPLPGAAGAHLLARVRRARQGGAHLQRAGGQGRGQGADRHRPRPPRLGLGRLALPRDRGDEGRLRRHRRLAAAERDAQRGRRRLAGSPSTTAAAWASASRIHAGMVVVADGTPQMAERLERVLTTDPGTGVMRHADAGYEEAVEKAVESGLDLPMVPHAAGRADEPAARRARCTTRALRLRAARRRRAGQWRLARCRAPRASWA